MQISRIRLSFSASAQALIDQVRAARAAGREPITEAGTLVAAVVRDAPDDAAARAVLVETYAKAARAEALDPGLQLDRNSNHPAPGPSKPGG